MKRRVPPEIPYAQDGPNGRPKREIIHRWMSAGKRRSHKLMRREGKDQIREQER